MYNNNPSWAERFEPSPEITPEDVVKIQLEALQNNDLTLDDGGIRTAFRFASPDNRAATGPLGNFITLVKNPLYKAMIGFEEAKLTPMRFAGKIAQQHVTLLHRDGSQAVFVFTLSRQTEGAYAGCWMTDGVLRVG